MNWLGNRIHFFFILESSIKQRGGWEFDIGLSYRTEKKFGTFFGEIHIINPEILGYPRIHQILPL